MAHICGRHTERDLEDALVAHFIRFLTEPGVGFAFVGRQYPVVVCDSEYRIDFAVPRCGTGSCPAEQGGAASFRAGRGAPGDLPAVPERAGHRGPFCCSVYCLTTLRGAPPTVPAK
ncbi:PDDEXK nuclease domain-containing protein [Streptomyces sp. NPDC088260]|uniref:PDDEXK nuclease domain-containing protein n=1 Tax=Streptomyces sp. NPDC088260 TaxID=3365850 RepID=UPI0037FDCB42